MKPQSQSKAKYPLFSFPQKNNFKDKKIVFSKSLGKLKSYFLLTLYLEGSHDHSILWIIISCLQFCCFAGLIHPSDLTVQDASM